MTTMPLPMLTDAVARYERRYRAQQSVKWLPRAMAAALTIGVIAAIIARVRPTFTPSDILVITGVAITLIAALALAFVWGTRRPLITSAQRFDLVLGTGERVTTAIELNDGTIHAADLFLDAQRADAEAAAAIGLGRLTHALPLHVEQWELIGTAALAVILAVLLIVPNSQNDLLANSAAVDAAIADAAETLRDVAEETASDPVLSDADRAELMEVLRERIDTLEQGETTASEAFTAMSETAAEFQQRADALRQGAGSQSAALQDAAEAVSQAANNAQTPSGEPGQTGESAQAAQSLSESLQALGEQTAQMSEAERQAAAQALREAAAELAQNSEAQLGDPNAQQSGASQAAESMNAAAESLESGDTNAANEQLSDAQQQAEQAANEAARDQQSADQMSEAAQQARESASEISEADQQGERGQTPPQQANQEGPSGSPSDSQSTEGESDSPSPAEQGSQPGEQGQGESSDPSQTGEQGEPSDGASQSSAAGDSEGSAGSDEQSTARGETEAASQGNDPDGEGTTDYDPVFAPRNLNQPDDENGIELEADPSDSPVQEGDFTQNPDGEAVVPYSQVYSQYRGAADRALDGGYVPLALRDSVRDYFSALQPDAP